MRLHPLAWVDLIRAAYELAIANRRLRSAAPGDVLASIGEATPSTPHRSDRDRRIVDRVAFAVPRVGKRVPWRADCLVQALAAKRWLDREGIASTLSIGVRDEASPEFEAHAWLKVGDKVVTGGDLDRFVPLHPPEHRRVRN